MPQDQRCYIAITGAQGVGKSTFCGNLAKELERTGVGRFQLLDDLRGRLAATGVPLGSASTPETIHAVWVAHLEREAAATGEGVMLDRCVVDALAYTRVLAVSSPLERRLYEQVGSLMLPRLDLVIHLQLSPFFLDKGKAHETTDHRLAVAGEIETVLGQAHRPTLHLAADEHDALERGVSAVRSAFERHRRA